MNRRRYLSAVASIPLIGVPVYRSVSSAWSVGIWQSQSLTDRGGRVPEEVAIETIEKAFDHGGLEVEIDAGNDPVSLGANQTPTCSGPVFDYWFSERSHPSNRSNVLLTDFGGGGCASVGGSGAVVGAGHLTDTVEHAWSRSWSRVGVSLFALLHELAHNAGYTHEEPTGFAYEIGDEIHVSPATTWAVDDPAPSCGGDHPDIDPQRQVFHLYYSPCTQRLFEENR